MTVLARYGRYSTKHNIEANTIEVHEHAENVLNDTDFAALNDASRPVAEFNVTDKRGLDETSNHASAYAHHLQHEVSHEAGVLCSPDMQEGGNSSCGVLPSWPDSLYEENGTKVPGTQWSDHVEELGAEELNGENWFISGVKRNGLYHVHKKAGPANHIHGSFIRGAETDAETLVAAKKFISHKNSYGLDHECPECKPDMVYDDPTMFGNKFPNHYTVKLLKATKENLEKKKKAQEEGKLCPSCSAYPPDIEQLVSSAGTKKCRSCNHTWVPPYVDMSVTRAGPMGVERSNALFNAAFERSIPDSLRGQRYSHTSNNHPEAMQDFNIADHYNRSHWTDKSKLTPQFKAKYGIGSKFVSDIRVALDNPELLPVHYRPGAAEEKRAHVFWAHPLVNNTTSADQFGGGIGFYNGLKDEQLLKCLKHWHPAVRSGAIFEIYERRSNWSKFGQWDKLRAAFKDTASDPDKGLSVNASYFLALLPKEDQINAIEEFDDNNVLFDNANAMGKAFADPEIIKAIIAKAKKNWHEENAIGPGTSDTNPHGLVYGDEVEMRHTEAISSLIRTAVALKIEKEYTAFEAANPTVNVHSSVGAKQFNTIRGKACVETLEAIVGDKLQLLKPQDLHQNISFLPLDFIEKWNKASRNVSKNQLIDNPYPVYTLALGNNNRFDVLERLTEKCVEDKDNDRAMDHAREAILGSSILQALESVANLTPTGEESARLARVCSNLKHVPSLVDLVFNKLSTEEKLSYLQENPKGFKKANAFANVLGANKPIDRSLLNAYISDFESALSFHISRAGIWRRANSFPVPPSMMPLAVDEPNAFWDKVESLPIDKLEGSHLASLAANMDEHGTDGLPWTAIPEESRYRRQRKFIEKHVGKFIQEPTPQNIVDWFDYEFAADEEPGGAVVPEEIARRHEAAKKMLGLYSLVKAPLFSSKLMDHMLKMHSWTINPPAEIANHPRKDEIIGDYLRKATKHANNIFSAKIAGVQDLSFWKNIQDKYGKDLLKTLPAYAQAARTHGIDNPDFWIEGKQSVKFNLHKLRILRDNLAAQGKTEVHPKELGPGNWNAGRMKNGNINIQKLIDNSPASIYGYTNTIFTMKGAQQHRPQDKQPTFQLALTDDLINQIKALGPTIWEQFRDAQQGTTGGGHPTGPAGLGWIRWDTAEGQAQYRPDGTPIEVDANGIDPITGQPVPIHRVVIAEEAQTDLDKQLRQMQNYPLNLVPPFSDLTEAVINKAKSDPEFLEKWMNMATSAGSARTKNSEIFFAEVDKLIKSDKKLTNIWNNLEKKHLKILREDGFTNKQIEAELITRIRNKWSSTHLLAGFHPIPARLAQLEEMIKNEKEVAKLKIAESENWKKVRQIVWQGKHPSQALQETFMAYCRDVLGWSDAEFQILDLETKKRISLGNPDGPPPQHFIEGYRILPRDTLGMLRGKYGDNPYIHVGRWGQELAGVSWGLGADDPNEKKMFRGGELHPETKANLDRYGKHYAHAAPIWREKIRKYEEEFEALELIKWDSHYLNDDKTPKWLSDQEFEVWYNNHFEKSYLPEHKVLTPAVRSILGNRSDELYGKYVSWSGRDTVIGNLINRARNEYTVLHPEPRQIAEANPREYTPEWKSWNASREAYITGTVDVTDLNARMTRCGEILGEVKDHIAEGGINNKLFKPEHLKKIIEHPDVTVRSDVIAVKDHLMAALSLHSTTDHASEIKATQAEIDEVKRLDDHLFDICIKDPSDYFDNIQNWCPAPTDTQYDKIKETDKKAELQYLKPDRLSPDKASQILKDYFNEKNIDKNYFINSRISPAEKDIQEVRGMACNQFITTYGAKWIPHIGASNAMSVFQTLYGDGLEHLPKSTIPTALANFLHKSGHEVPKQFFDNILKHADKIAADKDVRIQQVPGGPHAFITSDGKKYKSRWASAHIDEQETYYRDLVGVSSPHPEHWVDASSGALNENEHVTAEKAMQYALGRKDGYLLNPLVLRACSPDQIKDTQNKMLDLIKKGKKYKKTKGFDFAPLSFLARHANSDIINRIISEPEFIPELSTNVGVFNSIRTRWVPPDMAGDNVPGGPQDAHGNLITPAALNEARENKIGEVFDSMLENPVCKVDLKKPKILESVLDGVDHLSGDQIRRVWDNFVVPHKEEIGALLPTPTVGRNRKVVWPIYSIAKDLSRQASLVNTPALDDIREEAFHMSMQFEGSDATDHRNATLQHLPMASIQRMREKYGTKMEGLHGWKQIVKKLSLETPEAFNNGVLNVKFGINKLRQLRTIKAAEGVTSVHPKELKFLPKSIDINKAREKNGNINLDQLVDSVETAPYTYSEHTWMEGMQQHARFHNGQPTLQVGISTPIVNKLKEAGLWDMFTKLQVKTVGGLHPVGPAGLGWVRYDGDDKKGLFTEEYQTDLGTHIHKSLAQYKKIIDQRKDRQAKDLQSLLSQGLTPEAAAAKVDPIHQHFIDDAEKNIQRVNDEYPPDKVKRMNDIIWSGKHPSEVLQECFQEFARKVKGWTGSLFSMFDVDVKAENLGDRKAPFPRHYIKGYREIPRDTMGWEEGEYGDHPVHRNPDRQGGVQQKRWDFIPVQGPPALVEGPPAQGQRVPVMEPPTTTPEAHGNQPYPFVHVSGQKIWKGKIHKFEIPDRFLRLMNLSKNESVSSHNLEDMEAVAEQQLGFGYAITKAFDAARYLVDGDDVPVHAMMRAYEGLEDPASAALRAYGMEPNRKNIESLKTAIDLSLTKQEVVASYKVVSFLPEGNEFASCIQRGIDNGFLNPIKLTGKHSKGTMIVKDPTTHKIFLLKPGSGKNSPALGVDEDFSTQSEREVAFWHVAKVLGLGGSFPEAELVLVNGHQTAAMELLPRDYKNLGEAKKGDPNISSTVLRPYLDNGMVHKWAALDWILGNPDRHSQNIMVDPTMKKVYLIDHGSAMAGHAFDPGSDDNSFIPYYLRAFSGQRFKELKPHERTHLMPELSASSERQLETWLNEINERQIEAVLSDYHINPEPALMRLGELRAMEGPKSAALNRLWAGDME